MKGILKQASKGWFVWYESVRADLIANGYDSLPVLQLEFSVSEKQPIIPLENNKQVEFEIVRYCPYHKCSPTEPKGCTIDCAYTEVKYAKLIEKKVQTNGERFDEFMEGLNQPPYPELEGTLEVCKDIINFRTSEISDEEIEQACWEHFTDEYADMWSERLAFKLACKWYREQFKKK
jgi:hypothetical protein